MSIFWNTISLDFYSVSPKYLNNCFQQFTTVAVLILMKNHHKWLCAPKTSGFLYVRRSLQSQVHPTVISHAENTVRPNRTQYLARFDWVGTYDPTPILATTAALDFLDSLRPGGLTEHLAANHQLALQARDLVVERLQITSPAPTEMIGSMAAVPLPDPDPDWPQSGDVDPLQRRLYEEHRIEVPVFRGPGGKRMLRFSAQAYNDLGQYERLAAALQE